MTSHETYANLWSASECCVKRQPGAQQELPRFVRHSQHSVRTSRALHQLGQFAGCAAWDQQCSIGRICETSCARPPDLCLITLAYPRRDSRPSGTLTEQPSASPMQGKPCICRRNLSFNCLTFFLVNFLGIGRIVGVVLQFHDKRLVRRQRQPCQGTARHMLETRA